MVLTYFIILLTIHIIIYKTSNSRSSCTSLCKYDYITFNAHTHRCSCVQKWKVKQQSWTQGWGVKVWRVLTLSLFLGKMLIYRWKIIKNLGDHTLRFLSIQEIAAAPPPSLFIDGTCSSCTCTQMHYGQKSLYSLRYLFRFSLFTALALSWRCLVVTVNMCNSPISNRCNYDMVNSASAGTKWRKSISLKGIINIMFPRSIW